MLTHDLPAGVPEWLADVGGGEVTRLQRAVSRREAWVVDVQRPGGDVTEGFLRLERVPKPDNPWSLARETRIVEALKGTAVPVPAVFARSDALACTLFERVPGLELSVSATTRPPREGEWPGADYHFLSTEEFEPRSVIQTT